MDNGIAQEFDSFIRYWVNFYLETGKVFDVPDYKATDSFGEAIEKLVILHIRTWMLEDSVQEAKTDVELAELKRKIDICFKVKRPKLVAAINAMMEDAIVNGKKVAEPSVKQYKGLGNV